VQLQDLVADPGDPPVPQASRRATVRGDLIPQPDCPVGSGGLADLVRRVERLTPQRGGRHRPPTLLIQYLDHVGDQHVIVRARIPRPARRVPGHRENQA